jgi:hypothetical protein
MWIMFLKRELQRRDTYIIDPYGGGGDTIRIDWNTVIALLYEYGYSVENFSIV